MSDIKSWSNSAGGNTSASPNGWPEGMAPSSVNDCAREMMAALRRQHEAAEWIDYGWTPTFLTTGSFSLAGDRTTQFHIGRRIKASDASTLFGTISDVTYSANTRVNVTLDSGQFAASLSAVSVGILSFTNQSIPAISATAAYSRSAGYVATAGYAISSSYAASANYAASAGSVNYLSMPTEAYDSNSATISVGGVIAVIKSVDLGSATIGDRVILNYLVKGVKGGTAGDLVTYASNSGTSTCLIGNNLTMDAPNYCWSDSRKMISAGESCAVSNSFIVRVTASGTVILGVAGYSPGSDFSIAPGYAQVYASFLKKL